MDEMTYTFVCSICDKPMEEMFRSRPGSRQCYGCYRELKVVSWRTDPRRKEKRKSAYWRNPSRARADSLLYHSLHKREDHMAFSRLKQSAKARGIPFDVSLDVFVAKRNASGLCPCCGEPFYDGDQSRHPRLRSIDRLDSSGTYVESNIVCICYRCNVLKGDGTADEHQQITDWMRNVPLPEASETT